MKNRNSCIYIEKLINQCISGGKGALLLRVGCLVYLANAERALGLHTQDFTAIIVQNVSGKNHQWMLGPGETGEAGCAHGLQVSPQRLGIK